MLYGRKGMVLQVPVSADVLEGAKVKSLDDADSVIRHGLDNPVGSPSLASLLAARQPDTVAITISDITRPVPNEPVVRALLEVINGAGIDDGRVVIIIATGMHRPSTPQEQQELLGEHLLGRCQVVDHHSDDPSGLVRVSETPPVSVNRRFIESEFKIVTGLIEPHFMAGFSGGRKGVCPALVDMQTVQRFHGYKVMGDAASTNGLLEGNPCHLESLRIARLAGVDFLVNVSVNHRRQLAGVYCGDMEQAHLAGTKQVGGWTTSQVAQPYDLIVTNGGGYPLDRTFYQSVKGIVTPLHAMHEQTTLLIASECGEGVGSQQYNDIMMQWGSNWQGFLKHIGATNVVVKDQWQYQMHARVLARIGAQRIRFVTDGLALDTQRRLAINPVNGSASVAERCQGFVDQYVTRHPNARIAAIPDGPYTMIRSSRAGRL